MMKTVLLRSLLAFLLATAALLVAGEAALAQSAACQRYRAELAALDRGASPVSVAAERQRVEIARLSNYYQSIGCERRSPFSRLFGGPAPAECNSIAQRIRQMRANYAELSAQGDQSANIERRRQLRAAIEQACSAQQQASSGPLGFFESLFGLSRPRVPEQIPEYPLNGEENLPLGGRRLVCVRTCDGFFFPLSNTPNGREGADEMCQALCPGSETVAFAAPSSDDALHRAVSLKGRPYTSLPTAFKFQKSFDESCTCKKGEETWSQVLRRAEGMLDQRRGDIIVTAQKAEELSRPKISPQQAKKAAEKKMSDEAEAQAAADAGAAAPTASQESSGIGPKSIETSRVIGRNEGPAREVRTADGAKKTVRIVAPNVIPVPDLMTR